MCGRQRNVCARHLSHPAGAARLTWRVTSVFEEMKAGQIGREDGALVRDPSLTAVEAEAEHQILTTETHATVEALQATLPPEVCARCKLSADRLRRPKLLFLLRIVQAVTEQTGFAEGLYDDATGLQAVLSITDPAQIGRKDDIRRAKMEFFNRLQHAIAKSLGERSLPASTRAIITGTDAVQTNSMLQKLCAAATQSQLAALVAAVEPEPEPALEEMYSAQELEEVRDEANEIGGAEPDPEPKEDDFWGVCGAATAALEPEPEDDDDFWDVCAVATAALEPEHEDDDFLDVCSAAIAALAPPSRRELESTLVKLQERQQETVDRHDAEQQVLPQVEEVERQELQRRCEQEQQDLLRQHEQRKRDLLRRHEQRKQAQRQRHEEEKQKLWREQAEAQHQLAELVRRERVEDQRRDMVQQFKRERFVDEATAIRCLEQATWDLAEAMKSYMPRVPDSPMSGRNLASSNFKVGYNKATVPKGQMQLGGAVIKMVEGYCAKNGIDYEEDEGEHFFEKLQAEAMLHPSDTIAVMAQRMWTSALQLRGREFCFILNELLREDAEDMVVTLGKVCRAINELCVTAGRGVPAVHPPNFVCYRGAGFDDKWRSFFVAGRKYRQPAYLATSFCRDVAEGFLWRSVLPCKILWIVHIDPSLKCVHVNLVRQSNVDGEEEYLFAPYSAFTVLSAKWGVGTNEDPHMVELAAAPDNRTVREDLDLAPYS